MVPSGDRKSTGVYKNPSSQLCDHPSKEQQMTHLGKLAWTVTDITRESGRGGISGHSFLFIHKTVA